MEMSRLYDLEASSRMMMKVMLFRFPMEKKVLAQNEYILAGDDEPFETKVSYFIQSKLCCG